MIRTPGSGHHSPPRNPEKKSFEERKKSQRHSPTQKAPAYFFAWADEQFGDMNALEALARDASNDEKTVTNVKKLPLVPEPLRIQPQLTPRSLTIGVSSNRSTDEKKALSTKSERVRKLAAQFEENINANKQERRPLHARSLSAQSKIVSKHVDPKDEALNEEAPFEEAPFQAEFGSIESVQIESVQIERAQVEKPSSLPELESFDWIDEASEIVHSTHLSEPGDEKPPHIKQLKESQHESSMLETKISRRTLHRNLTDAGGTTRKNARPPLMKTRNVSKLPKHNRQRTEGSVVIPADSPRLLARRQHVTEETVRALNKRDKSLASDNQ